MRLRLSARPAVVFGLALLALVVAAADPALAADAGHEQKTGGLSFLDLQRYDLGIFTLIVFGLLCAVLYWFAWPKISEGLDRREAAITSARDEAIRVRQEAEEIRSKLKVEFDNAHGQIRAMLDEARRDGEVLRAKEREAGQKEAAAERDRARREIETATDAAKQELNHHAVQLAALMSEKAIRRKLTIDDQNRLVEESLAELKAGAR
ncbi:MAG TPA: ATP synthase F0 subunit B [Fimbriiglobus sp.]|jgi:F-type H+-transporting ATPase subunit b|nr:ATP synthase F0 subunit B [Fimbriiglobus sp.]